METERCRPSVLPALANSPNAGFPGHECLNHFSICKRTCRRIRACCRRRTCRRGRMCCRRRISCRNTGANYININRWPCSLEKGFFGKLHYKLSMVALISPSRLGHGWAYNDTDCKGQSIKATGAFTCRKVRRSQRSYVAIKLSTRRYIRRVLSDNSCV